MCGVGKWLDFTIFNLTAGTQNEFTQKRLARIYP